jgi:hypothetical protein
VNMYIFMCMCVYIYVCVWFVSMCCPHAALLRLQRQSQRRALRPLGERGFFLAVIFVGQTFFCFFLFATHFGPQDATWRVLPVFAQPQRHRQGGPGPDVARPAGLGDFPRGASAALQPASLSILSILPCARVWHPCRAPALRGLSHGSGHLRHRSPVHLGRRAAHHARADPGCSLRSGMCVC